MGKADKIDLGEWTSEDVEIIVARGFRELTENTVRALIVEWLASVGNDSGTIDELRAQLDDMVEDDS